MYLPYSLYKEGNQDKANELLDDLAMNILYDENELRQIDSAALYDIISVVQQNVFIFYSTIRDNITMFKRFDEADVQNAIELSGLSALIEEKGIDYLCGENGNKLSGGEKQRISIARMLAEKKEIKTRQYHSKTV